VTIYNNDTTTTTTSSALKAQEIKEFLKSGPTGAEFLTALIDAGFIAYEKFAKVDFASRVLSLKNEFETLTLISDQSGAGGRFYINRAAFDEEATKIFGELELRQAFGGLVTGISTIGDVATPVIYDYYALKADGLSLDDWQEISETLGLFSGAAAITLLLAPVGVPVAVGIVVGAATSYAVFAAAEKFDELNVVDGFVDFMYNVGEGATNLTEEVFGFFKQKFDAITTSVDEANEYFASFGAFNGETSKFNDDLWFTPGDDYILLKNGDDVARGRKGADEIKGNLGDDDIRGNRGSDTLLGGVGNDSLRGDRGRDSLVGGSGKDTLAGGSGKDTLAGGRGKDTLDGGGGNDKMTGGARADTFIFSAGNDEITDFNAAKNKEKIDLSVVASIKNFTDLRNDHTTQDGSDLVIDDANGNTLTLIGLSMSDLDKGDFIF
jgi:hypothetical protein